MKTFKNRVSYYFRFTLLFLITALLVYAPFLLLNKSLVWEHDSYTQHIKAMVFISRWYRQSLKALIRGNWKAISTYSFTFGYGSEYEGLIKQMESKIEKAKEELRKLEEKIRKAP